MILIGGGVKGDGDRFLHECHFGDQITGKLGNKRAVLN